MLQSLKIENYALIKQCDISFPQGFSVITGETGAGKTILLGALSLVLGQRADTNVLMDKEKKCVVEAVFTMQNDEPTQLLFKENDIDFDVETIFRREILPSGKSRAFINDTPVQLSVIKLFATQLVDIHSQTSTINLKDRHFQLSFVDNFLADKTNLENYRKLFVEYKTLEKEIQNLKDKEAEFLKDKSYNEFLFNELEQANLQEDEQEQLEEEIDLMSNAETIKDNVLSSLFLFDNENDNNILRDLTTVKNNLQHISSHNKMLAELLERVNSSCIELKDIYQELSSFDESIVFDKERLEQDNNRLTLIYNLQTKHNVQTIKELLAIKDELDTKLQFSFSVGELLENKNKEKETLLSQLDKLAQTIHTQRLSSAKEIEEKIKPLLASMSMKDAVLKVNVENLASLNENGSDSVCFLFSANKTKDNSLSDMSKVISGGELSRLMLALKAVVAERFALPTMVFDEIDTGISGDIASKAAEIMKQIGNNHQVIVITHLVQMAAKAQNHYKVYKQVVDKQTISNISLLNQEERLKEIATMISGDSITKEALANASKLLE